jgi:general secretion pathway protein J
MRIGNLQIPTHQRGFTLLEVLIAVAIFSIMAVMGYSGLSNALNVSATTQEHSARLQRLQMALLLIQRDFEQYYNQPGRNQFGDNVNSLLAGSLLANSTPGRLVEVTRIGWRNPLGLAARGVTQRVAYEFEDGKFYRQYWPHMFQAPEEKPLKTLLLEDLEEVRFEFRDSQREWHTDWPPLNQAGTPLGGGVMPILARITLVFDGEGEVEDRTLERWIELPSFN